MSATAERQAPPEATAPRPQRLLGLRDLPGPWALPGPAWRANFLLFARDPLGYLEQLAAYGPMAIFAKGMEGGIFRPAADRVPATVFAYGPDLLGKAFNSGHAVFRSIHISTPPGASYARLSWGLQRLHGEEHRKHRKLVMPAFHGKRLDGYRNCLVEAADAAMSQWVPGGTIDLVDETRRLLLVFLNKAFLGLGEHETRGVLSLGENLEILWKNVMSVLVRVPVDLPFSPRRRARHHADSVALEIEQLIARKRQAKDKGDDMLAMLLDARDENGGGMTEDELVGQLSFLIFAGFESTIHAVAFAADLVAQHPEVAARLYEEVHGLLKGDAPTVDQLKALPYLDAVTKECLRLLSPVPFLIRTTQEEVELGGYLLPPRTEIMLSIYHTHRMSAIYTDPNRFQPERWASIEPSTYEYLPFSVGPHMCAGWALALMEMKVLLSMFVQRFRLDVRPTDRIDRRVMATMGPRPGMFLNVHRQDKNFAASRAPVVGQLARMVEIPFA